MSSRQSTSGNAAAIAAALPALVAAFAASAVTSAGGGDAELGRARAILCQNCHGMDGIAKVPEASNLAGQTEIYLAKALDDFRKGARKHEVMSIVAATLSDADVRNLAAYYSAIEISVKVPK